MWPYGGDSRLGGKGFFIWMTISTDPEYIYYQVNEDGSFEQKRVRVEGVKIYETEGQPFVRERIYTRPFGATWTDIIEFHVPPGTVIQQFKLNAE